MSRNLPQGDAFADRASTLGKPSTRGKEYFKSFKRVVYLKPENRTKLNRAGSIRRRYYSCSSGANPSVRLSEVGMIKEVDGIGTDFKLGRVTPDGDREFLGQTEIQVGETRSEQDVPPGIAK